MPSACRIDLVAGQLDLIIASLLSSASRPASSARRSRAKLMTLLNRAQIRRVIQRPKPGHQRALNWTSIDLAISRACLMNSSAAWLNVRFFKVTAATGHGLFGSPIGKTLSEGDLVFASSIE